MVTDYGSFTWPSSEVAQNASVGPTNTTAPTSATEIGIIDGSGNLQGVSASNPVPVTGTITVAPAVNTNGSFVTSAVVTTSVIAFAPPANAVGFILETSSSNTVNIRWAIVTLPTTTTGMRAEPGRDTGYIPCAATVNVIAESGSGQEVEITWVKSS